MKVYIDTDVLIDTAVRIDRFPHSFKLLNDLIESPDFSLWTSAISLNNIEYIVSKIKDREKAMSLLELIKDTFSIIPFRRSVFLSAFTNDAHDFEDQIQIASAEQFFMDYIITRNVDHFINSKIPVLTPTQFLHAWDRGELGRFTTVPFLDLKAQQHQIYNEIDDRMTDIITNTGFIMGKYVDEFEERFAELQGAKYCVGVSSGTDALHVALLALGIGPGDKVVVPVNTFVATAEAVSLCGAEPVFVDCDEYYNVDVEKLERILRNSGIEELGDKKQITNNKSRITCIIPVHLYGQPANMDEIMALAEEYGLYVVEDCAQAHLARYRDRLVGNFGAFGAFSFYPGKNLGAYGEAGALITNDDGLYEKARMIRQHGEIQRYQHQVIGHNYRMEAFQGAVLSVKAKYLAEWTEKRRANAALYHDLLKDVVEVQVPMERENVYSVYHLYVIQADRREALQKYLLEKGVATGLHYPTPLHLQPAYQCLGYKAGDFPSAEAAAKRILSLPMYPELDEKQIRYIADTIKAFYTGAG